jgi:hypothetical protein
MADTLMLYVNHHERRRTVQVKTSNYGWIGLWLHRSTPSCRYAPFKMMTRRFAGPTNQVKLLQMAN